MLPAEILLKKIFADPPLSFQKMDRLDVLVICAGSFPSYLSFVKVLFSLYPKMQNIHFTLIEPSRDKTEIFKRKYPKVNVQIYNITLENFLKYQSLNKYYDIIYFEHPDMRLLPIFLNKLCRIFFKTVSLRESIAYLPIIFKEDVLLMASNMSKHENRQLWFLFKLCFKVKSIIYHAPTVEKDLFQPFSSGLYAKLHKNKKINYKKNAKLIRKFDRYFFIVALLLLCILGWDFFSSAILRSFLTLFLIVILFLYYRPDGKGLLLIGMILALQIVNFNYSVIPAKTGLHLNGFPLSRE